MDLSKASIFRMMSEKMDWLSERQKVLAQNVANADTPGYSARDLAPMTFDKRAGSSSFSMALARTDPKHIQPGGESETFRPQAEREPYETAPSKNGVVLEEQMVKVAETQTDHQMITNLYRKHLHMLQIALGRGQ